MSDRNVRARFYVESVTKSAYNPEAREVTLSAAGRGETNKEWAKYTPSGKITMQVNNPSAAAWFDENLGRDLEITFAVVPEEGPFTSQHGAA